MAKGKTRRVQLRGRQASFLGEAEYIAGCALRCDARVVTLGPRLFFSTEKGDAWMLDPEDGLARCLARAGELLPSGVSETAERFAVEWNATYRIAGDAMVFGEAGQERAVMGYAVSEIQRAIGRSGREPVLSEAEGVRVGVARLGYTRPEPSTGG